MRKSVSGAIIAGFLLVSAHSAVAGLIAGPERPSHSAQKACDADPRQGR